MRRKLRQLHYLALCSIGSGRFTGPSYWVLTFFLCRSNLTIFILFESPSQAISMDHLIALIDGACLRMQSSALHWVSDSIKSKSEPKKPEKFKTQLCHHYSQNGFCRFGSSCWFAHGENELRSVSAGSSFSSPIGSRKPRSLLPRPPPPLMFGSSCWFAHGENEPRSVSAGSSFSSPIGSRKPRSLLPRPPPSLLFNIFPKNP